MRLRFLAAAHGALITTCRQASPSGHYSATRREQTCRVTRVERRGVSKNEAVTEGPPRPSPQVCITDSPPRRLLGRDTHEVGAGGTGQAGAVLRVQTQQSVVVPGAWAGCVWPRRRHRRQVVPRSRRARRRPRHPYAGKDSEYTAIVFNPTAVLCLSWTASSRI